MIKDGNLTPSGRSRYDLPNTSKLKSRQQLGMFDYFGKNPHKLFSADDGFLAEVLGEAVYAQTEAKSPFSSSTLGDDHLSYFYNYVGNAEHREPGAGTWRAGTEDVAQSSDNYRI